MKIKLHYFWYFTPFLLWMVLYCFFSFDGLYGQDSYEYLRYTEALKSFMETGKPPGDYFWGVYYPILGALLNLLIPDTAVVLQLVSVFSLGITSVYLTKIIPITHKENHAGAIPFLFFTCSPMVLIHGILIMSDMLACCFTTLAVYYFLVFLEKDKGGDFILGAVFAVLALLTRYAAAVVLLPFCFSAFVQLIQKRKYWPLFFSMVAVALISIPHLVIRSQNSLAFLSHPWLQSWSAFNLFHSDFSTVDGEMKNRYVNFIYCLFSFFHPIFLIFGILLVYIFLKNRRILFQNYQNLFLASLFLYALFLGGIPFQNKRFLLLSFPLVIAFLFPLLKKLSGILKNHTVTFIVILLIQLSLGFYYGKPFYERNALEKNIADQIRPFQGSTLYSFDIDIALKNRKLDFRYKSLWKEKLPGFEKNALLLVNEKQLEKQWKDKNPYLNWKTLQEGYQLEKLQKFSGNFNLYRIVKKK